MNVFTLTYTLNFSISYNILCTVSILLFCLSLCALSLSPPFSVCLFVCLSLLDGHAPPYMSELFRPAITESIPYGLRGRKQNIILIPTPYQKETTVRGTVITAAQCQIVSKILKTLDHPEKLSHRSIRLVTYSRTKFILKYFIYM